MDSLRGKLLRSSGFSIAIASLAVAIIVSGCASPVSISMAGPQATATASEPAVSEEATTATATTASVETATPATVENQANQSATISVTGTSNGARLRTAPPSMVRIPSIGLETVVLETPSSVNEDGWTWALPRNEAAHHLGTANPGEPGNVVISGHVVLIEGSGVFEALPALAVGSEIVVDSADGAFSYVVTSNSVIGEQDVRAFAQSPNEELTLITCVPDGIFEHRVVVRAVRAGA